MISPYVYVGLDHITVHHHAPQILFDRVLQIVGKDFKLDRSKILSRRRWRDCVYARQVISYILRVHYRMTVTKIGILLDRDHSTIIHATNQHFNDYEWNGEYREICDRILMYLGLENKRLSL